MNTSQKLYQAGQSVWYDNIQRKLLANGEMERMISQGEIYGVTSNPTIFMKAISGAEEYEDSLAALARAGLSAEESFYRLAVEDIQAATDLFAPLYARTGGGDGYVSLEVNPRKANDTAATIEEALRLWNTVNRPNLMIKIPATPAGLPAITAAIRQGVNVNVTLIFSRQRYAQVVDAYLRGLEARLLDGLPVDRIASVASFFVSRVDTKVDALLEKIISGGGPRAAEAAALRGKAAVANARLVYADFQEIFSGARFERLRQHGARKQRPLWASTSTKNPEYSDVMYVEELVGPDTVNTVPPQTLTALLDHAAVRPGSLESGLEEARQALAALQPLGISFDQVTQELEDEGVQAFADSFTDLLETVEQRRTERSREGSS